MLEILITALLISNTSIFYLFNDKKSLRYRHWYRPLLSLLLLLFLFYFRLDVENTILSLIPSATIGIDLAFCIAFSIIWLLIKFKLWLFNANDIIEQLLRKFNGGNEVVSQQKGFNNYLLWPYYISGFTIYKKVGFKLYQFILWTMLIAVPFAYYILPKLNIYVFNSILGVLFIPILLESILYFTTDIPSETEIPNSPILSSKKEVDFYQLFKRYIDQEKGFLDSLIFGYFKNKKSEAQQAENKLAYISNSINNSIKNNSNFIVSSNDFIDTIPKFSALFLDTLKKGGNILLLADIPNHTKYKPINVGVHYENENEMESISKIFSVYLEQAIEHHSPMAKDLMDIGYYDGKEQTHLSKRIILTNIDYALSPQLIHSKWIKELDLVMVVQFNDAYVNNLQTQRKLSQWFSQQKINYKTVLFKIFRASGDEALTNTWVSTTTNLEEIKLKNTSTAHKNYFLNFAYEKSEDNLNKIFEGNTYQNDFSPGIELSVFALMENLNHIHYFEGYNLDYIQSKNKLENAHSSLQKGNGTAEDPYNYAHNISQNQIKNAVLINNLPFIVRPFDKIYCKEKHLSIVYDVENNAPKLYQKYSHLGLNESFVCIISKPHLFRDFFAEQISYFTNNTLEALSPQLSKAPINLCLQLFHLLSYEKVEIAQIKHLLNQHKVILKQQTVVDFISQLFKEYLYLDIKGNAILKYDKSCVFKEGKFKTAQYLSIDYQALETNSIFNYLKKVKVVDTHQNIILEVPKYLLFQNFLPQQSIIINGTSYQYNGYNTQTNQLQVNAIATQTQTFYKTQAHIQQNTKAQAIDTPTQRQFFVEGKEHTFELQLLESEIELSYLHYYAFEKYYYSHQAPTNTPTKIDLTPNTLFQEQSKRKYATRYLKLQWDIAQKFQQNKAELNTQLHHLLYEFLPILFPYRHQYIQIASNNTLAKEHREKTPWLFAQHNLPTTKENSIEIYIIEDSFSDLGILKAIQEQFEYIIKHLYDLLLWLQDNEEYYTTAYTQYVKGKAFAQSKNKLDFLHYGLEKEAYQWNLKLLTDFIKENSSFGTETIDQNHQNRSQQKNINIEVECDYCAQKLFLSKADVMEDGLHRCQNCKENAVDFQKEVKELEQEAKALYHKILGIDIDQSLQYQIRFVSATKLHQYFNKPFYVTNQYDHRTAIGLASDREIDIIHIEKHRNRVETLSTIIHEIMHIYQYQHLNFFKIQNNEPLLIEGMTTWAEHFLLSKSGNKAYEKFAEKEKQRLLQDHQSVYGKGFQYIATQYPNNPLRKIKKRYKK